jgi:periplasmic protein TonB
VFEDSLFASTARPNPRRGWAAVASFGLQAAILGILVLVPMVFTDALPVSALRGTFVVTAPVRASALPKPPEVHHTRPNTSDYQRNILVQPRLIPSGIKPVVDHHPPDSGGEYSGPPIEGAIAMDGGGRNDAFNRIIATVAQPAQPHVSSPSHGPVRISRIDEGLLIHKVTPVYPKIAVAARQQGAVVLQATIGRDGTIQNLRVIGGPGLLIQPAMDAVKQWRYKPYILNNEAVEVETQITVNFTLDR